MIDSMFFISKIKEYCFNLGLQDKIVKDSVSLFNKYINHPDFIGRNRYGIACACIYCACLKNKIWISSRTYL